MQDRDNRLSRVVQMCYESGIGRRDLGVQRFRLPTIHPLGPYIPLFSFEKVGELFEILREPI
jgi:hypothetical protein